MKITSENIKNRIGKQYNIIPNLILAVITPHTPPLTAGLPVPFTADVMGNQTRLPSSRKDSTCLEDTLINLRVSIAFHFCFSLILTFSKCNKIKTLNFAFFLKQDRFHVRQKNMSSDHEQSRSALQRKFSVWLFACNFCRSSFV